MESRIEELCCRANQIADQIGDTGIVKLWYVFDALSAELYQLVMWCNASMHTSLVITQEFSNVNDRLIAENYGRVFDLCHYRVINSELLY